MRTKEADGSCLVERPRKYEQYLSVEDFKSDRKLLCYGYLENELTEWFRYANSNLKLKNNAFSRLLPNSTMLHC